MSPLETSAAFALAGDSALDLLAHASSGIVSWLITVILPITLLAALTLLFLGIPRMRAERVRFFLDLLGEALRHGRSPEPVLVSIARSGDAALGPHFHLLAANLESGLNLIDAIDRVPGFLPPQVVGMLRAGARAGDLRRLIPACRASVSDTQSRSQAALNYHLVLVLLLNPVFVWVNLFTLVKVFPVYSEISRSFGNTPAIAFVRFAEQYCIASVGLGLLLLLWNFSAWLLHLAGPSALRWLQSGVFPAGDWLEYLTPWRRCRMRRNFLLSLGALLDAGVHEAEALALAANATGNAVFRVRAHNVLRQLEAGLPLAETLHRFDPSRELRWRFENAVRDQSGFTRAVEVYGELLESRAFRAEQIASNTLSTALVFLNGLTALVLVAAFMICISGLSAMIASQALPPGMRPLP